MNPFTQTTIYKVPKGIKNDWLKDLGHTSDFQISPFTGRNRPTSSPAPGPAPVQIEQTEETEEIKEVNKVIGNIWSSHYSEKGAGPKIYTQRKRLVLRVQLFGCKYQLYSCRMHDTAKRTKINDLKLEAIARAKVLRTSLKVKRHSAKDSRFQLYLTKGDVNLLIELKKDYPK